MAMPPMARWQKHRRSGGVPQTKVADPIDFRRAWPSGKRTFTGWSRGESERTRSNVMRSAQSSPATGARSSPVVHPRALLCPDAFLSPLEVDEAARRGLNED